MKYFATTLLAIGLLAGSNAAAQPAYKYNDRVNYKALRYDDKKESSSRRYDDRIPYKRFKEKRFDEWGKARTIVVKKTPALPTRILKQKAKISSSSRKRDVEAPKLSEYKKPTIVVPPRPDYKR